MRYLTLFACLWGCASAESQPAAGPKRPLPPDEALLATPAEVLDDDALAGWVARRLTHAQDGHPERVRVPLTGAPRGSDGPSFGMAAGLPLHAARAVVVRDRTSAGLPVGETGWLGWAFGRFTGEVERGAPVLEVFSQYPRDPTEPPVFHVLREPPRSK